MPKRVQVAIKILPDGTVSGEIQGVDSPLGTSCDGVLDALIGGLGQVVDHGHTCEHSQQPTQTVRKQANATTPREIRLKR